ncbi:MAG: 3-dehydroquinate synthase [Roseimicrobium sp.]
MMEKRFSVEYAQRVLFTRGVFDCGNDTLRALLATAREAGLKTTALAFVDRHVLEANPELLNALEAYAAAHADVFALAAPAIVLPGGELCKNDFALVEQCWQAINDAGLDRHSFVFVIGGGAVLDLVCFAASTAHRGIRHVRFPTTTLSQGDGGVGVKNGVNYFGKKNWVGAFSVPYAVVNDFAFLDTLTIREKRCGLIEAIKVALIRDAAFYHWIEDHAAALASLDTQAIEYVVRRSAELHVEHIATSGDPFEQGSARPLDFGHWAAHKLEQVSRFAIAHGEAVAIGIAVDLLYSAQAGLLDAAVACRIIELVEKIGFTTYSPHLHSHTTSGALTVLEGLEEFREHLGGELTVTLVPEIGRKIEVHEMDHAKILEAVNALAERAGCPDGAMPMMEQAFV